MDNLGYAAVMTIHELPMVLVLLTGLVVAGVARDRLPRRPRILMYSGLGVLLVDAGIGLGWALMFPRLIGDGWARESGTNIVELTMIMGLVGIVLQPVGLGLIIASALTGRRATDPVPTAPWGEWTPPATSGETGSAGWGGGDFPPLPAPPRTDATERS